MKNMEKIVGLLLLGIVAYSFFGKADYYSTLDSFVNDNLTSDKVYAIEYDNESDKFSLVEMEGVNFTGGGFEYGDSWSDFQFIPPDNRYSVIRFKGKDVKGLVQFENFSEAWDYVIKSVSAVGDGELEQVYVYANVVHTDLGEFENALVRIDKVHNYTVENDDGKDVYCYLNRKGLSCFVNGTYVVNLTGLNAGDIKIVEYGEYHGNLLQMLLRGILSLVAQREVNAVMSVHDLQVSKDFAWNVRDELDGLVIGRNLMKFVYATNITEYHRVVVAFPMSWGDWKYREDEDAENLASNPDWQRFEVKGVRCSRVSNWCDFMN
jgi:hypothetical protein